MSRTVDAGSLLADGFDDLPLGGVVYTDIAKDGMLEGPNLSAQTEALARRLRTPVIASGGVSNLSDHRTPGGACRSWLAIVGRALYDRRFRLSEARERAGDRSPTP